jgi:hypothetical protein
MAGVEEADGGRNRGIAGERHWVSERKSWGERLSNKFLHPRRSTYLGALRFVCCFKICARSSDSLAAQKITCFLQFLFNKLEVPVTHYYGTVVPSGTVSLVPSILQPSDQVEWTVIKNVNLCKTCNSPTIYSCTVYTCRSIDIWLLSSMVLWNVLKMVF